MLQRLVYLSRYRSIACDKAGVSSRLNNIGFKEFSLDKRQLFVAHSVPLHFMCTKVQHENENDEEDIQKEKIEKCNTENKAEGCKERKQTREREEKKKDFKFNMPEVDFHLPTPREMVSRTYAWLLDATDYAKEQIIEAYKEMTVDTTGMAVRRKVSHQPTFRKASDQEQNEKHVEEAVPYEGPQAIVHVKEDVGAWEAMKMRLSNSPIMQELLKKAHTTGKVVENTTVGKASKKVADDVRDKVEDVREFWETSQNPIIYAVAGTMETMTGETEEGLAIGEFRKMDPDFDKEMWAKDMEKTFAPELVQAHMNGDLKMVKERIGEAVYHKLQADIDSRTKVGLVIDPRILDFAEHDTSVRYLESIGPVIVSIYKVQQVHCVRNDKGEIVEGDENDIRAKFYHMVFQQAYEADANDETIGYYTWKAIEYGLFDEVPYY